MINSLTWRCIKISLHYYPLLKEIRTNTKSDKASSENHWPIKGKVKSEFTELYNNIYRKLKHSDHLPFTPTQSNYYKLTTTKGTRTRPKNTHTHKKNSLLLYLCILTSALTTPNPNYHNYHPSSPPTGTENEPFWMRKKCFGVSTFFSNEMHLFEAVVEIVQTWADEFEAFRLNAALWLVCFIPCPPGWV